MFTAQFWKATLERTLGTIAAAAIAVLGADGLGLADIDWDGLGSVAGLAGLLTVLKAIVAASSGAPGPGFGGAEALTPGAPEYRARHAADDEPPRT